MRLIKEETENEKWAGWIFCESDNNEGWVPKQIIEAIDGNSGVILKAYLAVELNIKHGEIVSGMEELNGWVWAIKQDNNEEGWLPLEILQIIK